MTSTPDSISTADLIALSQEAQEREEADKLANQGPFPNGMSENRYHTEVTERLAELHNDLCHPMFAKIVSLELLNKLVIWHSDRADQEYADGRPEAGICWARDAGKLQAAMSQIMEVVLPDDYIHRDHSA